MKGKIGKLVPIWALLGLAAAAYGSPPPVVQWSDSFNYPDGALAGNDGWAVFGADGSKVNVTGGVVQIDGSSTVSTAANTFATAYLPATGEIDVHFNIRNLTSVGNTTWTIWLDDANLNAILRVYGPDTQARGRNAQYTNADNLAAGWNDIDIQIMTGAGTAKFLLNGVAFTGTNPIAVNAATGIGRIRIESTANGGAPGETMQLDNFAMGTTPEPATLGLLALGGLLIGRRRARA